MGQRDNVRHPMSCELLSAGEVSMITASEDEKAITKYSYRALVALAS